MTASSSAPFVAVDWGTTRMRATLVGMNGEILGRAASESGVQSVPAGGYQKALDDACEAWFSTNAALPVLMSGMVGSRNGWLEAPYVSPPCGPADLAARLIRVPNDARPMFIVPGVDCRTDDGGYDVMRGEEIQAFGAGVKDGLVCLPGTHSKWVEMEEGRITRFVTFATGELYAALVQSFVGRLAEEPADVEAGQRLARTLSQMPGGLTRQMFQARTQVLSRNVSGRAVRPFLSGLLIEAEISGARDLFGAGHVVHLVAADPQLQPYRSALLHYGFQVIDVEPEGATLAGLTSIAASLDLTSTGPAL
ncbi:2-dehydro-3-deoxygalactonokinase [Lichenifustis flavocetrariae]|uniref:2-dehydro-3-deoxygalactonokinase n=1 Tax=Lichenifustis flavocetrariae TaxID=2949735 RepID=A0AA41Z7R1_9HYPH|nr:2-dehydro-3-deoxygalactonokinase [Lichenifustis flavocetrariae]MCW6510812.1 2-dehydro-3-deoxygalactonokinase [Lichenifustis flavocetrariae]